jgi:hypothetical protein
MLMIARCGVTAERQHVDCWSVSSPAAPNLASIIKRVSHEFCTLLLVHLCNTRLHWLLMIARCGVTAERQHVDCWSVSSPAAPNLASIIKSVSHEFCTPAASSFVHHAACAGYVDDRERAYSARDIMLTAGL